MMKGHDPNSLQVQPTPRWVKYSLVLNAVALTVLLRTAFHSLIPSSFPARPPPTLPPPSTSPPPSALPPSSSSPQPIFHECRAPLPPFLATQAPSGAEAPLREAIDQLEYALQCQFDQGGIDSLSVAVVGSEGSLYEGFWGRRRANESDGWHNATVDRNSIYRIASISKLFTALETLILRDSGLLQL